MNLHEYQAKNLLKEVGVAVPEYHVITEVDEALSVYASMPYDRVVVKAQVHAGGRGKAGGVRIVNSKEELATSVKELLGTRLVTYQTDANGQPVNQLLIEAPCEIKTELYLGAVIDRATQSVVFMASQEGGVDIEKVAHDSPEKIIKCAIEPLVGVLSHQVRAMASALDLKPHQTKQFAKLIKSLYEAIVRYDIGLIEINPLVINAADDLICLDAKINIDDNALYRQANIREMRDPSQEDERENHAHKWELSYISLDGEIGCMVNGAGLAMATMDIIKLYGGNPANFLDVGGGATKERVTEAFKIILSDSNVKAVLVNIFGGIVRCDLIADGIIGAIAEVGIEVPVVVRLEGNNAEAGREKLSQSGLNIIAADSFDSAAEKVVAAVKGDS
ncbi:MAG: ADP-forming succinate--CoA ligase subunit beta [Legionellales bacterium]|jgi:succinyl-CoA synthetase beta subunit|nr:ADP-forming succinate--CoA ligase subunit beta [Legionellales bacterium]